MDLYHCVWGQFRCDSNAIFHSPHSRHKGTYCLTENHHTLDAFAHKICDGLLDPWSVPALPLFLCKDQIGEVVFTGETGIYFFSQVCKIFLI